VIHTLPRDTMICDEFWTRDDCVGSGGFGVVFKQTCIIGPERTSGSVRVVKELPVANIRDIVQGLRGMFLFSQAKVCNTFWFWSIVPCRLSRFPEG
jgi:hypothetical protein